MTFQTGDDRRGTGRGILRDAESHQPEVGSALQAWFCSGATIIQLSFFVTDAAEKYASVFVLGETFLSSLKFVINTTA